MRSFAICLVTGMLLTTPAVLPAQAAPVNRTVAVVNGEMITSYDLSTLVAQEAARRKLNPQKPADQAALKALEREVLEQLINEIVVAHEAERLKIVVTDGEVDDELRRIKAGAKLDDVAFESELKKQGTTLASFKDRLRKNLLRSRLLGVMVGRKVLVSKEEIAKYYEQHGGMIDTGQTAGGQARVAVLVYRNAAEAKNWAPRIKSGKVSFDSAVREVSVGPMRESGGVLGAMALQDMAPGLRAQVEKLKPGQVSEPFVMDGVTAQVRLLDKNEASSAGGAHMSLEEATPHIERILREPRLQERYNEYTDQLRKRAMVDVRL